MILQNQESVICIENYADIHGHLDLYIVFGYSCKFQQYDSLNVSQLISYIATYVHIYIHSYM